MPTKPAAPIDITTTDAWKALEAHYKELQDQGIDLKACVISEAVHTIMLVDIQSLLQGITLERVGCLRNVFCAANVV